MFTDKMILPDDVCKAGRTQPVGKGRCPLVSRIDFWFFVEQFAHFYLMAAGETGPCPACRWRKSRK